MHAGSQTGSWNVGSFNQRSLSQLIRTIRDQPISPIGLYHGLRYFSEQLSEQNRYCPCCTPDPAVMIKQIDFGDFIGDVGIEIYSNRNREYVKVDTSLITALSNSFDRDNIFRAFRDSDKPYIKPLTGTGISLHASIFDEFYLTTGDLCNQFIGRGDVINENIRVDGESDVNLWIKTKDRLGLCLTKQGLHRFTRFAPHKIPIMAHTRKDKLNYVCLEMDEEKMTRVDLDSSLGLRLHRNCEELEL